uniref:SCP domain-containing protein n=1 Tax=Panagrolaimus sp. ES5 TaxID=591445 RepID=A0AC34FMK5_9BILA
MVLSKSNRTINETADEAMPWIFDIWSKIYITQHNGISVATIKEEDLSTLEILTNMINGDAVSIGCAKTLCDTYVAFYCGVSPHHLYGSPIYDVGIPCS